MFELPPPSLVLCVDSGANFWLPSDNSKAEDGKNDRQGSHSESIAFADGGWCQHGRGQNPGRCHEEVCKGKNEDKAKMPQDRATKKPGLDIPL